MTIENAQTSIASELNKNVKNPVVEVQLVNFKLPL